MAFLWGNPQGGQVVGTLVKFPAGFSGQLRSRGSTIRAVVIDGELQHSDDDGSGGKTLPPGSYFDSKGKASHQISCIDECIVYVRSEGKFDVIQTGHEK